MHSLGSSAGSARNWQRKMVGLVVLLLAVPVALGATPKSDDLTHEFRALLEVPILKKLNEIRKSKNSDGINNRRATYSRDFRKVDDTTYLATIFVGTAETITLTTERIQLTLKQDPDNRDHCRAPDIAGDFS